MRHTRWSYLEVKFAAQNLPPVYDNDELWKKIWTRDAEEFGLIKTNHTPKLSFDYWPGEWDRRQLEEIPVRDIRFTYQSEGIRLDVLGWYLDMANDGGNFDDDGWFNNDEPVLVKMSEGCYAVKDGNHRVIVAKLKTQRFIRAYVMEGAYA